MSALQQYMQPNKRMILDIQGVYSMIKNKTRVTYSADNFVPKEIALQYHSWIALQLYVMPVTAKQ